jgi:hypothetical protein
VTPQADDADSPRPAPEFREISGVRRTAVSKAGRIARPLLYLSILCAAAWLVLPYLPDKFQAREVSPASAVPRFELPESLDLNGHWQLAGSSLGLSVTQLSRDEVDAELKAAVDQISGKVNDTAAFSQRVDSVHGDAPATSEADQSLELQQTVGSLLSLLPNTVRQVNGYRVHSGQHFGTSFQVITSEHLNGPVYSILACWPAENQQWNLARIVVHADADLPVIDWAPDSLPISGPPLAVRRTIEGHVSGAAWPCNLMPEQVLEWLRTHPGDFLLDESAPEFLLGRWKSSPDSPTVSLISLHGPEFGLLILLK